MANINFDILEITIDDVEKVDNIYLTNEDREIFFKDAEIPNNFIEDFVLIDEIIDYKYTRFDGNDKKGKSLLKICSEFMSLEINKDDMHNISIKKGKDYNIKNANIKNIKLNNYNFIIKKNSKDNLSKEIITVPFISNVYVKDIKDGKGKDVLHPPNAPIISSKCRNSYIRGMDLKNPFHTELNRYLDSGLINKKFTKPNEIENVQEVINRVMNYYRAKRDYKNIDLEENAGSDIFTYAIDGKVYGEIDNKLFFLKTKPVKKGDDIQNLYYCFDIDNKINLLEKIIHKGIDDEENDNIMNNLRDFKKLSEKYQEKINVLIKKNAINTRIEHICKKRYPNFFNPASNQFIFSKNNLFDLSYLPESIQNSILAEYKLLENNEEKIAQNKCKHKLELKKLREGGMDFDIWKEFKTNFISPDSRHNDKQEYINCSACSLPLICPHETEYFDLFFNMSKDKTNGVINFIDKIEQILTTKFGMSNTGKHYNSASVCKICGMEINKMLDTDGMNYNEADAMYKGNNVEIDVSNDNEENRIIMYAISRNLSFTKPVGRNTANGVVNSIYYGIKPILYALIKKRKKQDLHLELNLTILVMACIMILSIKYDFIEIKKDKVSSDKVSLSKQNIIIQKKSNISSKFKETWDIFYMRYKKVIEEAGGSSKNIEVFKKLFIKCYDLLKETIEENIHISDLNIVNYSSPSTFEEYSGSLWDKSINNKDYKKKSHIQFSSFISEDLISVYVSDRDNNSFWKKYNEDNRKLKETERNVIQNNIKNILYPYWRLPYSYERYYTKDLNDWSDDMALFACPETGKRHSWGVYSFIKKDTIQTFKISSISSNPSDLEFIKEAKIHSLQCTNCKLSTNDLVEKFKNVKYSDIIENKVNDISDIKSFYTSYKYRCIKQPFHNFIKKKSNASLNSEEYKCSHCKIKFSYIKSMDREFYEQNKNNYISYIKQIEFDKNKEIYNHKIENEELRSINLNVGLYSATPVKDLLKSSLDEKINNILRDKKIKNCIINLGKSENSEETLYMSKSIDSNYINDTYSKISDRIRQIIIYLGILHKTPSKHKYMYDSDFLDMLSYADNNKQYKEKIAILYNYLINQKILDSFHSYKFINSDGKKGSINYGKSIILYIIEQTKDLEKLNEFIVNKLIDSELIYTNYNYAELKKTYNMNRIAEDNINSNDTNEEDGSFKGVEETEMMEEDQAFGLFEMSDLSMNNFEDDDIE